jgi:hypothetical protein
MAVDGQDLCVSFPGSVVDGLDSDVAAIALSKAVGIALLDRQVNPMEDQALATLLEVMKH